VNIFSTKLVLAADGTRRLKLAAAGNATMLEFKLQLVGMSKTQAKA
jgi:hypothetical protein